MKEKDLQDQVFVSPCSVKPLNAILTGIFSLGKSSIKSQSTAYLFRGANITHTTRLFNSADCSGDAALTFEETGDIKVDKDHKTNDGGFNLDIDFTALQVVMSTQEGATAANAIKLCGNSDWAPKQSPRTVTSAAQDANCYGAKLPRHIATVYRLDAGNLFLGEIPSTSNDDSTRPSKLDPTKYVPQR